jgi:transcriptional regulator of nitric oxide reductase
VFDRIEVIQGAQTFTLKAEDYLRIDRLHAAGALEFKEISIFRLRGDTGFDPWSSRRSASSACAATPASTLPGHSGSR